MFTRKFSVVQGCGLVERLLYSGLSGGCQCRTVAAVALAALRAGAALYG